MVILSIDDILDEPDILTELESWDVCDTDELSDVLALVDPETLVLGPIVLVPVDGKVTVTVIDCDVETVSVRFTNVSVSVEVA